MLEIRYQANERKDKFHFTIQIFLHVSLLWILTHEGVVAESSLRWDEISTQVEILQIFHSMTEIICITFPSVDG